MISEAKETLLWGNTKKKSLQKLRKCFVNAFFTLIFALMKENRKVLLGMSGGTDSSVAALLLQDAGYEVTGVTFRFYEKDGCTEYLDDARDLCRRLGKEIHTEIYQKQNIGVYRLSHIPHLTFIIFDEVGKICHKKV